MTHAQSIHVDQLPQSVEEFVAQQDQVAQTPQGGAAMMVVALLAYAEDSSLGQQCLAMAVDRGRLQEGRPGHGGWGLGVRDLQLIQMQVGSRSYIPRSYIQGTTPRNGYRLPEAPYRFEFAHNPYSGDEASGAYKVFLVSSGADSARPVSLRRKEGGLWKAWEWSSLLVGVRPPAG